MASTHSSRPTGFSPGEYPATTRDAVGAALRAKGIHPGEIEIAMIWAQTTEGVIGDGADMPWYLPEDLKHFKDATMGYPVVMGRTSWEALEGPYQPLPGRKNFVVTRRDDYFAPGGFVVSSLGDAIADAAEAILRARQSDPSLTPTVWILGGGQVYAQCMEIADRVEITEIEMTAPERFGVYAPEVPEAEFDLSATPWRVSEKGHTVDGEGNLRFRMCTWRRKTAGGGQ
ncbi:MAG TPA: dihydrofolate reductase [Candidatus Corynebacterium gallistercoris]|uniref:dihydrofolate reductase n=1 Tax=Candidatus Corynebacterium gallistercoris TaxID=2838530 RepID=A0A9D1UQ90_9CORY|nr:dihydrofolate reductase [Candidatus Corynebacterium gallistercoris]